MTDANYDWSRFVKRIPVNADLPTLYNAISTPDGLEHWFLRKAEFTKTDGTIREGKDHIQKGDHYEWRWHGFPDTMTEHGEVLEVNGKDMFRFVFGKAGIVTMRIYPAETVTIFEIIQENIPTDEKSKADYHIGCMTGWLFYLVNLKSLYEGGADLRNKNVKLQEMVNA